MGDKKIRKMKRKTNNFCGNRISHVRFLFYFYYFFLPLQPAARKKKKKKGGEFNKITLSIWLEVETKVKFSQGQFS